MSLFRTSKDGRDILELLRRATAIRPNVWARAALGYSLSLDAPPQAVEYDSGGQEFQDSVFFGKDEAILTALLRQKHGIRLDDEAASARLIKLHVERGIRFFQTEFQRLNRRGDEFILALLERCTGGIPGTGPPLEPVPQPGSGSWLVRVEVGQDQHNKTSAYHILNGPGLSPHISIMGRTRSGKTRTALRLLRHIATATPYRVPFLIFDYSKGDIADNAEFVKAVDAKVVHLPEEQIPLSPLALPAYDEQSVKIAVRRLRDTINSVVRLGPKQSDRCLQIIREVYLEKGSPELEDLAAAAEEFYLNEDPDSLLACFREFSEFRLFKRPEAKADQDLFASTHVIDVSRLPDSMRKLAVFLTLDRLYTELMNMSDAPPDKEGNRQMRLIIAIDEAHNYLPCKQPTLEKLVREAGSKGVAIMLMSQSPDDFDQPRYNFAREMGLAIVFSCVLERPKMLEALLGGRVDPQRLSQLGQGIALTRLQGSGRPSEIRAW